MTLDASFPPMSLAVRNLLVGGCLLAAVAVAGCGTQTSAPSASRTTVSPAPSSPQPVTILAPGSGSTIRGRRARSGAIAASVTVTGHADELQTVRVGGRCGARTCTTFVYTGADGRWTARLRLVLPARARRLTVTADYAVMPDAATRARLTVPVHATTVRSPTYDQPADAAPKAGTTQPEPQQPQAETDPVAPSSPSPHGTRALVLVGDSLAVGLRALLPGALSGWNVEVLGRVGRPLSEGMAVIDGLDAFGSSRDTPPVLAVSLFTNDDPTHTGALQTAVRRTLELVGPHGCVVWATIARPPVNGVSYRAANAVLEGLAASDSRLHIVAWAEQVEANPQLLAPDSVHPTPAGYELRARLYARAAQDCR
jgi:hypothetical protein